MIPYVVINGISSKTINGLLIQSLPPISKPKIRTEVEEIDGRDGDIVTTLGYSAYDKPISIGLYGEYNVDDIIDYFSQSGKIVFSNEPDKYYIFSQYDQIDFERLIRFKTATVNIHVQPFKYSDSETVKNYSYSEGTTTASISIRNDGNIYSKPTLTITGRGDIIVYLNDAQILTLDLDEASDETIIIDASKMNAYSTTGAYLNRRVTGDYANLRFKRGTNNLRIDGAITSVSINNYSRWL
jgi:predicted phage tail component-like protein